MFSKTVIYKPNPRHKIGFRKTKILNYISAPNDQVYLDSSYTTKELNCYTTKDLNYYTTKTIHSNRRESQIPYHL